MDRDAVQQPGNDPATVYFKRLGELLEQQAAEQRQEKLLGYAKVALAAVTLVSAVIFLRNSTVLEFLLVPVVAFVFLASCQDQVKSSVQPPDNTIYTVVDEQPTYVGGLDALMAYLQKEMKYPETAFTERVEGKVFVSFIVTKEGSVVSPAVVKGVREDMDKEALRVISGLPKWNPGRQKGRAVSVRFVLPINFKL